MEDAHKYLLTKQAEINQFYLLRESKAEYEVVKGKWELIGKYHKRLWFQKTWRKTEQELIWEYQDYARQMERLQLTIDECLYNLHMHTCAKEYIHSSKCNTPFIGLNLSQHKLIQQQLF